MKFMSHPIGVLLLLIGLAGCSRPDVERKIDWIPSIPLGIEQAEAGQALFVYFRASWCGVCEQVEEEMGRTTRVADALDGFVPVKIDVDAQPRAAEAYLAQAVPSFLIVDRRGAVRARAIGYLDGEELADFLRVAKAQ